MYVILIEISHFIREIYHHEFRSSTLYNGKERVDGDMRGSWSKAYLKYPSQSNNYTLIQTPS